MSIPWNEDAPSPTSESRTMANSHTIPGLDAGPGLDLDRVVRRELTPSRAVPAMVAAVIITLLALYGLLECGLRIVNQPAWLIDPQAALRAVTRWPDTLLPAAMVAIGVLLVVLGLLFLGLALIRGHRARHTLDSQQNPGSTEASSRIAVVVDDEVIASALAKRARMVAGVTQEQVRAVISQQSVVVQVRPTSGMPLQAEVIAAALEQELDQMQPIPRPSVRVVVSTSGVIGV
ncbi:DUF6286 domain-containing protein [Psychromicrobium xiongbiense]|uniref:DUF6286 domain-containing protein n=1 Tax=Psychromicrobium xiongbiense TaxID=3051184 RepID=UPI0025564C08|nr:DUF6286 domain-containing protein [Psychromicrobium sp. YIM S02556]